MRLIQMLPRSWRMTAQEIQEHDASIELIRKLYRSEDLLRRYRNWLESFAETNRVKMPPRTKDIK